MTRSMTPAEIAALARCQTIRTMPTAPLFGTMAHANQKRTS
jgi:hypothetical protein